MKLKVEKTHPHGEKCEDFRRALEYNFIAIIENEPQIIGKLPKTAKAGNLLTGEKYDPSTFMFNFIIEFCPFCGERIYEKPSIDNNPFFNEEF